MKFLTYSWVLFSLVLNGCQPENTSAIIEEEPLAKVFENALYPSDLDGIFPYAATEKDSNLIIKSFVNRWVKEMLFLHEAETNINPQVNIERLVKDYRSSLIRASYEKEFIENALDSTITPSELSNFYELSKDQFILEVPILRFLFLKIPEPVVEERNVRNWMKESDQVAIQALTRYAINSSEGYFLESHIWKDFDEVSQLLPPGELTIANISYKKNISKRFEGYLYLMKILEYREPKTIAPLSYVEAQAKKIILHNRKVQILDQKKEALLQDALRKQNVQFYY